MWEDISSSDKVNRKDASHAVMRRIFYRKMNFADTHSLKLFKAL